MLTDFWKTTKEEEDYLQGRTSDSDCKGLVSWCNNSVFLPGSGCGCFPGVSMRKRINVKSVRENKVDAHEFQEGLYIPLTEL